MSAWRLVLLVLPLALLVGYLLVQRRRHRQVLRFTSVDLLGSVIPRRHGWLRHLPADHRPEHHRADRDQRQPDQQPPTERLHRSPPPRAGPPAWSVPAFQALRGEVVDVVFDPPRQPPWRADHELPSP